MESSTNSQSGVPAGPRQVDQNTGGPLEGMSPQFTNMPDNDVNEDPAVYAELGLDGVPDNMNPGDEEASDTILYTDNMTARNATENVSSDLDGDLKEDELLLDEEMDRLNDTDVDADPNELRNERENDDTDRYLAY
ncbi:hypothetical protein F5984_08495 [Rudanella paleaurantiibacter]|uniref:Uncharacterized protein n=1 Tax=Rudanella paleaurantiibacter TaxID=2614655 RepID=A0A7J5U3E5_9BACT|nr:hypothetical protein [Rudanella paleaurantiibacter]KAB7732230.1 hypothetical protein F5984_08495 [Rudanella paleaurantiibacter]